MASQLFLNSPSYPLMDREKLSDLLTAEYKLQVSQVDKKYPSKGNFQAMLNALGERETGKKTGDSNQYKFVNPQLGFLGKYQFSEQLLIQLGYYKADIYYGSGADKNYWRGTWTNKRGISSKDEFLNSPEAQEAAIREAFALYWRDINYFLKKQNKSINQYLGQSRQVKIKGKSKTVKITLSGLMAASHLRGGPNMVKLLVNNRESKDEFGTSIWEYLDEFGCYQMTVNDFQ